MYEIKSDYDFYSVKIIFLYSSYVGVCRKNVLLFSDRIQPCFFADHGGRWIWLPTIA
jgi:hypothetical protein